VPRGGRLRPLSVGPLAQRLGDRFRLLPGGSRPALPRQQTLQATIDWSYDLLSEPERTLLRRLSVFAGGWTLEAAEAVCGGQGSGAQRVQRGGQGTDGPTATPIAPGPQPPAPDPFDVPDLLTRLVDRSLVVMEEQDAEARYRLLETVRQYSRDRLLRAGEAEVVRSRHLAHFLAFAEQAGPELHGSKQPEWQE